MLNDFFVPVYLRNQDFNDGGSASAAEKAEKLRIYREANESGLAAGTVCIYLLTPDGQPVDTAPLNQSDATNPQRMVQKLSRVAADFNVAKSKPLFPPRPQSRPPLTDNLSLTLHVTARYLTQNGNQLVRLNAEPVLGTRRGGNWGDLPSEDWVVLTKAESAKLLPSEPVELGTTWTVDEEIASRILKRFFPPTENTDFEANHMIEQSLKAEIVSRSNGTMRAKLTGSFKMKHPFYHRDDENLVNAQLVGYLDFEEGTKRIHSLRLITEAATYGTKQDVQPFGVALRSVENVTHD